VTPIIDVLDERVLILAPTGKDASLAADALRRDGLCTWACEDLIEVRTELARGAGALLLAEEALLPREVAVLVDSLGRQPPWSDVPVLVLTRGRDLQEGLQVIKAFSPLGNIILLERPLSAITLCTTVHAALRTRRRQYQVRDLIEEQKRAAEALRSSRQEVMELNADLEQRVAHRTAELSAANSELEAFCYSVSHDLRAPLRAIDGFALTVLDHCNGRLDETARSYIDRARKAAHRMQRLIDDLLGLSRLSRAQMTFDHVDLTSIANSVLQELRQSGPERSVEVRVESGLKVWGDAALLRIALDNLLGNAWKFTARKERPTIEFGSKIEQGLPVFFMRDNGAGFDMAYASKLFVPFQRLHTNHDFSGSGIGLAIVQRIIRRHDGEIWADGKPGDGATFYFRLPVGASSVREGVQSNTDVLRLNVEKK
jgi:signal transduction histidine kinase